RRFEEVRQWISLLQQADDRYRLEWKEINHRQLGRNLIPDSVWIDQPDHALQLIGQQRAAQRFDQLLSRSLADFPQLLPWLEKHPMRALEQAADWHKVLAVLRWFQTHPHSNPYVRQLDIAEVDAKFIEQRRGLLGVVLDTSRPTAHTDPKNRSITSY